MTNIYRLSQENKTGICVTLKALSPGNSGSSMVLAEKPAKLLPWKKAMPLLPWTLAGSRAQGRKTTKAKLSAQEKIKTFSMGKVKGRVSPQVGTSDVHNA